MALPWQRLLDQKASGEGQYPGAEVPVDANHSAGESAEHNGVEEQKEEFVVMTTTISIIMLLLLLILVFKMIKEYLVRVCAEHGPYMLSVLDALFGEMAVLGFISLVAFTLTRMPFFDDLNDAIFHDEGELLHVIERTHYAIFFVMIFYQLQVWILLRNAIATEREWMARDKRALHNKITGRNARDHEDEKQVLFEALREEFILERHVEPPFSPARKEHQLPEYFSLGRYFSMSLCLFLESTVEVTHETLFIFLLGAFCFYDVELWVEEENTKLAWAWVVLKWALFCFNVHFSNHVHNLKKAFASRNPESIEDQELSESFEDEMLSEIPDANPSLPEWCNVDLDKYLETLPFWKRWLGSKHPNRQQTLYWMDRKGPKCYAILLQVDFAFTGVYFAILLVEFIPIMLQQPTSTFAIYLVLALLPTVAMAFFKRRLVKNVSQVCSLGVYRHPEIVSAVLREDKMEQIVRLFIVLHKLRCCGGFEDGNKRRKFDCWEKAAIGRTFNLLDVNSNGFLTRKELEEFTSIWGVEPDEATLQAIMAMIDRNGKISKKRFISWYGKQTGDDFVPDDTAKELFHMFDTNNDREITIGQFTENLDYLSADDIGSIVLELGTKNGSIDISKFEIFVKKHFPKELCKTRH